jgi:hypothetical protein
MMIEPPTRRTWETRLESIHTENRRAAITDFSSKT